MGRGSAAPQTVACSLCSWHSVHAPDPDDSSPFIGGISMCKPMELASAGHQQLGPNLVPAPWAADSASAVVPVQRMRPAITLRQHCTPHCSCMCAMSGVESEDLAMFAATVACSGACAQACSMLC